MKLLSRYNHVRCFLFLLVLLPAGRVLASHAVGIDLSYACLGGNQYRFTVNFYRDCAGIAAPGAATIVLSSASCGVSGITINLPEVSEKEVSDICSSELHNTTCNGGTLPGIQQYTYSGVYTLPAACSDWVFSYTICCRNAAITNLVDPGSQNLYVQATLNNTGGNCISSPVFTSLPVPYICNGQPFNYNHGGVDPDGDSLSYSLVNPLTGAGEPIPYTNGYTPTQPMTTTGPFGFNDTTGQMTFTPNGLQRAVVTVLVEAWRNGVVVATTMRDMQVVVLNCSDVLPTATGIDSTNNFTDTICAGFPLCFNVYTNDADSGLTTTLTYNNAISGATFTSSGSPYSEGTFCWTPPTGTTGSYNFTLTVENNACEVPGVNIYNYTIVVTPNPNAPVIAGTNATICPGQSAPLTASTTATGPISYSWTPTKGVACPTCQNTTASPSTTTVYTVTATYPDYCESTSGVTITVASAPTVSVYPATATICSGSPITLTASSSSSGVTYVWNPGGLTGSTATVTPSGNSTYTVTGTSSNGCTATATSTLTVSTAAPAAVCDNIYVTTTGTGTGLSTSSPTNLTNALAMAACNDVTIKMATGTYNITSPITVTSYVTLEGGFQTAFGWRKESVPGATTIYREATNIEGTAGQQRLVAVYLNSAEYFRFQDITIQTASVAGDTSVSNYGIYMTNCSNYNFVRTQVIVDSAGVGSNGVNGVNGGNGGDGFNGTAGNDNDDAQIGEGGNGGAGAGVGAGAAGAGGDLTTTGTTGISGANGGTSTTYRAGGGGAGGGSGGSDYNNGGSGGNGGGVNGSGVQTGAGGPGLGAEGCDGAWTSSGPATDGGDGLTNSNSGNDGTDGANGANGTFVAGFFVPGAQASSGTDGQGGYGGTGGGGGGGYTSLCYEDGAGYGGGGGGGGGEGGQAGTGGSGGGSAFAVFLFNNGANGNFINCLLTAGPGGIGGTGGQGGEGGNGGNNGLGSPYTGSPHYVGAGGDGGSGGDGGDGGNGGNGANGISQNLYLDGGTAPVSLDTAYTGLLAEPTIYAQNISCTNTNITFSSASSGFWSFGSNITSPYPSTGSGAAITTQYDTTGWEDVSYSANNYAGFVDIALNNTQFVPNITTTASALAGDTFYVCAGSIVSFFSSTSATSYAWTIGGITPTTYTTQDVTGKTFSTSGTYTVKLQVTTDCCGLSLPDSIILIVEPIPTITFTGTPSLCNGSSTTVTASGSSSYLWQPDKDISSTTGSSVTFNPITTTSYEVTGYDAAGYCSTTSSLTITVNNVPTMSGSSVGASCSNNGSATAIPSGGSGTYTYVWATSPVQTGATATGLFPGDYAVTATDGNGCTVSDDISVGSSGTPIAYISASSDATCHASATGQATVSVSAGTGTPGYTYKWNTTPTQNTATATDLVAGTYVVTVTDAHGCYYIDTAYIGQPDSLFIDEDSYSPPSCHNVANASVTIHADGGNGAYTYLWSNASTDTILTSLGAGSYTVTVTDAKGCTATLAVVVANPSAISVTQVQTNVTCNGANNGAITVTGSGGISPYTYSIDGGTAQASGTFTGLTPTAHTILVTDSTGCDTSFSISITQPTALGISLVGDTVKCNGTATGAIIATVTGGTTAYQYSLNDGTYQASDTFNNLAIGTYEVIVKDANGCRDSASVGIIQPATAPSLTLKQDSVTCYGGSTGTIIATASGGTPTYEYSLNGGTYQASDSFKDLSAGTYDVQVEDSKGCTTGNIAITVLQPDSLQLTLSADSVSCNGDFNATVTVTSTSGGSLPYKYSDGGGYQTSTSFVGQGGGPVTVTVKDFHGCLASATINVYQPGALTISLGQTNITCNGDSNGMIVATVTSGVPPYQYSLNGVTFQGSDTFNNLLPGFYTVTAEDSHGCQVVSNTISISQPGVLKLALTQTSTTCYGGSNGEIVATGSSGTAPYQYSLNGGAFQSSGTFTGLSAGSSDVQVMDKNGCTTSASITVLQPVSDTISFVVDSVLCNGGNTGKIIATASNGTAPYQYSLDDGTFQASGTFSNLTTGTYTVIIKDNKGCTDSETVSVLQPALLTISAVQDSALCNGSATGTVTITANGGTLPYQYSLNGGAYQSSNVFNNVAAGVYTIEVKDFNACTQLGSITVLQPPALALTMSQDSASCNGGSNGQAIVSVSGGTPGYTYSWNTTPAQTGDTASGLTIGSYSVTITDANNCTATKSVTVLQPAPAAVSLIQDSVLCNGGSTGKIIATFIGGTAPFQYSLNGGAYQSSDTFSGLAIGTYAVQVEDKNNCTASGSITILQPAVLSATVNGTNILCNGGTTGHAIVTASGGTTNYSYEWSTTPAQTTATATGLIAGPYTVTVTDMHGCTTTANTTLTQPALPLSATINGTNILCNGGATGQAVATASGGTTNYSYAWSTTPTQTTATATGLTAGPYTVTVTDAHGCTTTANTTLTQPALPLSATINGTNILCNGGSTGQAVVTASGGTTNYSYSWSTTPTQTTATATGLTAGPYTVTVTDANSCTTTANTTLTQPALPLSATVNGTNVLCNGAATGQAVVTASGGTTNYSYAWSTTPVQITATATGLTAGPYTVTVTDANGCTTTANTTLTQPALPLSATVNGTNILCNGGATGQAVVTAAGGTTNYSYAWSTTPVQTTATATGLTAGPYTVTVTDAHGCTTTANTTLTQPALPLSATINGTNILCNGAATGQAVVTAAGGTTNYNYAWSTTPVQTAATATGLTAGPYTVTVTDANGCTTTANTTLTQPALPLSATINGTNILCNGSSTGQAVVTASGGTTNYTYAWSTTPTQTTATATGLTAGPYTVTVTDAHGCTTTANTTLTQPALPLSATINGTNILCNGAATGQAVVTASGGTTNYNYAWSTTPTQTTATATGLIAGPYTVTVTDANGCTTTANTTLTQPALPLSATIGGTNILCNGGATGQAVVTASGGTTNYNYAWSTTPTQTTATATGLTAGPYTVTVTDANGCTTTANATLTQPALPLSATINGTNILCNGAATGQAVVTALGGTTNYSYAWSTTPVQTTATATGLTAGPYTVTVTDANGCTTTANTTLTQSALPLSATINGTNILCNGAATGQAVVTASGGTTNYSYAWSTTPTQTTATATGLTAGPYTVTVTDAHGCTTTANTTLTQPALPLSATINGTNILCNGGSTGQAVVTASGGTTNYSYSWSTTPAQTTATATGLTAGPYTVTVTDANGCTTTANTTLTQPALPLSATINGTNILCNGGATGQAVVTASGGTTNYSYAWSTAPTQTTATATGLTAGPYTVTVTDANGCTTTANATLTQPALPLSATINGTNILCNGAATGQAVVTTSGGTTNYSYSWSTAPVQTTATATSLTAGPYTVTVTDANGCTTTANTTLTQPALPLSATINGTDILCNGGATGQAVVTASGGTTNYSYAWSTAPTQTTATATGLSAGPYTVTVTDAHGCTTTANTTLTQPALPLSATINGTNILCNGAATGQAVVMASGGTTNYSYSWSTAPIQTTATATSLTAGPYTVTVTDANGCTTTANTTLTQSALPLSATINGTNILCNGGSTGQAVVTASGGTTNYSYSWSTTPTQTTATATGLTAGPYTVTVADAHGCTTTANTTLTQPALPLSATINGTNILCNGAATGQAIVTASGGTTNYSYAWSTTPTQTTATATGLTAEPYTVTVTDANGCTTSANTTLTEPPTVVSLTLTQDSTSCTGDNGKIFCDAAGGVSPYQFSLNGGTFQVADSFLDLSAGSYSVQVKDANGCTATQTISVLSPSSLSLSAAQDSLKCNGDNSGIIVATVSGGTGPYQYSLDGGTYQTSDTFPGQPSGSATVQVEDIHNCTATAFVTVLQPASLTLSLVQDSVECIGGSTGSIIATGAGGTAPYQYSLNGGAYQSSDTFNNLGAGSYSVEIRDANNCNTTQSISVLAPLALSASAIADSVKCNGGSTGMIIVTAAGGTSPYQYSLNGGAYQLSDTFLNLPAGAGTVQVKDAHGCSASANATVFQPAILSLSLVQDSTICVTSTGMIVCTAAGGTLPYQYSLNSGPYQALDTFSNLAAGNYSVELKDGNGCNTTGTISVLGPAVLNLSAIGDSAQCNGGSTGMILATAVGGTSPYQYALNGGAYQVSDTFPGLAAGAGTVTVKDAQGCTASASATVFQPVALALALVQDSTQCTTNTGIIICTASGGVLPYQYSLNGGTYQTSDSFNNLAAGNYSVQVEDAHGCTYTNSISVLGPSTLTLSAIADSARCNGGSTGMIIATAAGGTSPYQYSLNSGAYQASDTFLNLPAGAGTVTVKDVHGCSASANATVLQPASLALALVQDSTQCTTNTGIIICTATGGVLPYEYSLNSGTYQVSDSFINLAAGSYSVQVQDGHGCTYTNTVNVLGPSTLTASATTDSALCNGGSTGMIIVSTVGGTSPYQYSLNGGAYQVSDTFPDQPAGPGTVQVEDAHGCLASADATIFQPAALTLSLVQDSTQCNGGSTGMIICTVTGGTQPYQYSLNGGAYQVSDTFNNLAVGNYSVQVKDAHGCNNTNTIAVLGPSALAVVATADSVQCNGGSTGTIIVTVSGGTSPYQYSLNNGAYQISDTFLNQPAGNNTVQVKDAHGCPTSTNATVFAPAALTLTLAQDSTQCTTNTGMIICTAAGGTSPYQYSLNGGSYQTSDTFSNLATGNYPVEVKDANGCSTSSSVTVLGPSTLTLSAAQDSVLCNGGNTGMIIATVSGGTSPYEYSLNGGTYQTSDTFLEQPAGPGTVTVKDFHSCSASASVTVLAPSAINLTLTQDSTKCGSNSGKVIVSATGGTLPYQFSLDGGTYQTSDTFSNLAGGSYTVQVEDAHNCPAGGSVTVLQPVAISVTLVADSTHCNGGSDGMIVATPAGGAAPYQYSLNNGAFQVSDTFKDLAAGNYSVQLKDHNNCETSADIVVSQPAALQVSLVPDSTSCFGSSNGGVTVTVMGGSSPYTYAIDGSNTFQADNTFTGLVAGTHSVQVKDANGCPGSGTTTVSQPAGVAIKMFVTPVKCPGSATGSDSVVVTGGTPGYTYNWSDGSTSDTAIGLPAGTVYVTVTDSKNCPAKDSSMVTSPDTMHVNFLIDSITCNGAANGSISIFVSKGTPFYTYQWAGSNNTTSTLSGLSPGTYTVTVTDKGGCQVEDNFTVIQPTMLTVNPSSKGISCSGTNNGTAMVAPSGGTSPYNILWAGGQTQNTIDNLAAGSYAVTITDAHQCIQADTIIITSAQQIVATTVVSDLHCFGQSTGSVAVSTSGGIPPYHYAWSTGNLADTSYAGNLPAGNYSVTVSDANGCSVELSVNITNPTDSIGVTITVDSTNVHYGQSIQLTATPSANVTGIPTYAWTPDSLLSCVNCPNPTAGPLTSTTTYMVALTDSNGCPATAAVTITVDTFERILAVPNAFSPNGDGINDVFYVYGYGYKEFSMKVFDRWGEMVFESNDQTKGWDGTYKGAMELPGVYVYLVEVTYMDGEQTTKKGSLTLIR